MRRFFCLWLCLWALFSIPWTSETARPRWDRVRGPQGSLSRQINSDFIRNMVFYVPLGPLAAGLGWSIPATMAAGSGLSLTAETLQLFSTKRRPDVDDIIANVAGTAIGAGLAAVGRRKTVRA